MYSTEEHVQLKWPNGVKITQKIEPTHNNIQENSSQFSQYLKVAPMSKKHIVTLVFCE